MSLLQQSCCWKGCAEAGTHPAPRRRQMPVSFESPLSVADDVPLERDYYCKQHIRDFNKGWDFFRGMSEREIEQFQKDAVTGHRRTQKIQPHVVAEGYRMAQQTRTGREAPRYKQPEITAVPLNTEMREALAVFGLEYPATEDAIKKRYRELVKQYHPDRIGKAGEEKIKAINQAYTCLQGVYS
jgi:DnaJ-domain-containing protein 1